MKKHLMYVGPVLFFLTACTVGPDYKRPTFFEDARIERTLDLKPAAQETDSMPFSPLDFKDETLNALLDEAVQNSPSIRSSMARLRQSRYSLRIAEVAGLPTLDASGKYNYAKESRNMGYLLNEDYYQAGLDMTWEIDLFGNTRRRTEAALANYEGAVEAAKNVNVSLTGEVALNYISLRTAEQQLKDARENLKLQENIYQTIKEKYQAGLTDEIALNQARYLVETTKMTIPTLEYQQIAGQNALALLLGKLPGELNNQLNAKQKNLVQKPFQYDVSRLMDLPASVVRNRPDVRVAEQQLIAGNAEVGAAIADMFPQVSLSAMLGFQALHSKNLFNHKSYEYGYVPSLTAPIFHFGALKNNVKLQEALREEYMVAYEQSLLNAAAEIKNALVSIDKERTRNRSARIAYQKMDSVASLMWDKYQKGLIEYSDVLDAQQRRLTAQRQMVDSSSALYQDIVAFYKAIGGTFTPEIKAQQNP